MRVAFPRVEEEDFRFLESSEESSSGGEEISSAGISTKEAGEEVIRSCGSVRGGPAERMVANANKPFFGPDTFPPV